MTTKRTELYQAIITCVFEACPSARIFGGYVLDMLTGDEPNDIDFLIPSSFSNILQKLTEKFDRVVIKSISKKYGSSAVWNVEITQWNTTVCSDFGFGAVYIDFVCGSRKNLPDADVKRLTLDRHGKVSLISEIDIPLQLLQRIQKKQYVAEVGMSQERHDKIRAKGWTEAQLP